MTDRTKQQFDECVDKAISDLFERKRDKRADNPRFASPDAAC